MASGLWEITRWGSGCLDCNSGMLPLSHACPQGSFLDKLANLSGTPGDGGIGRGVCRHLAVEGVRNGMECWSSSCHCCWVT